MTHQPTPVKDKRLVLRIDGPFIERLDRIAAEHFEGNRALATRQAIRELVERYERVKKEDAAA